MWEKSDLARYRTFNPDISPKRSTHTHTLSLDWCSLLSTCVGLKPHTSPHTHTNTTHPLLHPPFCPFAPFSLALEAFLIGHFSLFLWAAPPLNLPPLTVNEVILLISFYMYLASLKVKKKKKICEKNQKKKNQTVYSMCKRVLFLLFY